MDVTGMSTYLQTQYANQNKANAEATAKSVNGISKDSNKEEITKAVKDFETYMMEQVLKEVKDSFVKTEEEDSTMSMYKNFFIRLSF